MKHIVGLLQAVITATFIAFKLVSTALVGWSWWWLLFPSVPVAAVFIRHAGW